MAGSSIAAPDAASWVTDFVNAAFYRRAAGGREVDDLRLASCVLTTFWYRKSPGHRLRLTDLRAFHRAFGHDRFDTEDSARGRSAATNCSTVPRAARRLVPVGLRRRRAPWMGHRV